MATGKLDRDMSNNEHMLGGESVEVAVVTKEPVVAMELTVVYAGCETSTEMLPSSYNRRQFYVRG